MTAIKQTRSIAIIAHVDHGKTTLVDRLLQHSGTLDQRIEGLERVMDSNELEKERGITILSKHTAIAWKGERIHLIDTPGHADFGGEVERILSMVDSVLLLVDAAEGPMPQTRFVTQKAFAHGLKPIVVINKVDKAGSRPEWVIDRLFDLFLQLNASEEQLDFPVIYASALQGKAGFSPTQLGSDITALLDFIVEQIPAKSWDIEAPFRMQISQLDYSPYLGVLGIGRIERGTVAVGDGLAVLPQQGGERRVKLGSMLGYFGLQQEPLTSAQAGDVVMVSGLGELKVSDTVCSPLHREALPALAVDEPTMNVHFCVNNSPFAGREGTYLTSRQILARLLKEQLYNVALRVEETEDSDQFKVSGRGELHLGVLVETMRREGYEFALSRPKIQLRCRGEQWEEPIEQLVVDIESKDQGTVMEALGIRRATLLDHQAGSDDRVRLTYEIPSRMLLGFRSRFMLLTSGTGLFYAAFSHYAACQDTIPLRRQQGVLISNGTGKALAYALYGLQERGRLLIQHGAEVYEGQIIGIHSKQNDLTVNPLQGKKLTNMRAAGKDEALTLVPPIAMNLEQALSFIEEDELIEVTPQSIRLRKRWLTESERKRGNRIVKINRSK